MEPTINICFLGDTQVGKTTFLAALYRTNYSSGRLSTTFDDESQTGSILGKIADSIEQDSSAAPTTDTIRFQARLVWGKNQHIPIEFVDIPGESFSEAYRNTDDSKIKDMRSFINTCSFLYFFIDPELLEKDISEDKREIFAPLKNLYTDYYDKNRIAPVLCLALTKIDKYEEYDGDDGLRGFKSKINKYYKDDLEIIQKYTPDIRMACISSFHKVEEKKQLGLSEEVFEILFNPLKEMVMKKKQKKIIYFIVGGIIVLMLMMLLGYTWYEYELEQVRKSGKSHTGCFEYYPDQKHYVDKQLEAMPSLINDENVERVRKQYESLTHRLPGFKEHIEEQWTKKREAYRIGLYNRISGLIQDLRAHPDLSKCGLYDALCHLYTNNLEANLPPELILNKYNLFMNKRINEIFKIQYRPIDKPRSYVLARMMVLRDFIALKPESDAAIFSAEKLRELNKAMEIAEILCENRQYRVIIESKGLSKECDLFYTLQIGPDDAPAEFKKSKLFKDSYGARTDVFIFNWSVDQRIKVSLMTDHLTGEEVCADIWRDSSGSDIALSLFASDEWMENNHNFGNSYAKDVEFHFILSNSEGLIVSMEDIELVRRYILGNQFWNELKKQLPKP